MSKRVFFALVILMSLSLIGIIFVQSYYIKNAISTKEDLFIDNVKRASAFVVSEIENRDFRDYISKLDKEIEQGNIIKSDTIAASELLFGQYSDQTKETSIHRNGIFEENLKLSSTLFDNGLDSTNIKNIIRENIVTIYKSNNLDGNASSKFSKIRDSKTRIQELQYEDHYNRFSYLIPVHKRVDKDEINRLLKKKLTDARIDINYEFAIYSNGLATKIKTEDFETGEYNIISAPLFQNNRDNSNYELLINFPESQKFIWSSVIGVISLSIIFTSIILIVFVTALMQIMKQRKIAEIKTDFINNMTHEFKTPIATINLALDAIKNPKIINDKEKVARYLKMIKEENKRMHAQVENVLRISKLEKNELNISKEPISLHDLIEDAISHVELLVEDRSGTIETNLEAISLSILANETHFTNVLVNILDNAIKYSPEAPKIFVETVNVGSNILVSIKDEGSGMSKTVSKRVFEKFYREHTGNVHNVKGHGLGLAYVKRIVDDHHGHISVESEKDKGSTFIIKLPLIS